MPTKIVFLSIVILLASSFYSNASEFKVSVCTQRINAIPALLIYHIYVKKEHGDNRTVLSFGNENNEWDTIIQGNNVSATISSSPLNMQTSECACVLDTDSENDYAFVWEKIQEEYQRNSNTPYNLYSASGGRNCGTVAQQAIESAGLAYPYLHLNLQEKMEQTVEKFNQASIGIEQIFSENINEEEVKETLIAIKNISDTLVSSAKKEQCVIM